MALQRFRTATTRSHRRWWRYDADDQHENKLMPKIEEPEPEQKWILSLPLYTLWFKDCTGTVLYRASETESLLMLFTDKDAVDVFVEKANIRECNIVSLASREELEDFLQNYPTRSGARNHEYVVIDPIDLQPRTLTLFSIAQLLQSI